MEARVFEGFLYKIYETGTEVWEILHLLAGCIKTKGTLWEISNTDYKCMYEELIYWCTE